MTDEQLQRIEKELNIVLPAGYHEAMLKYPFVPEADCELPNDPDTIVEANRFNRENGFFGVPWPEHYFTFGGDGAGNDYYLDLSHTNSPVYVADHEDQSFTELAPSFETWLEKQKRDYAEFKAEELKEQREHANKKWWEFWK